MTPNPSQQRAIESEAAQVLCLAGPGSGKTGTLIERLQHLIDRGVNPGEAVVITFTNAAADEIRMRLAERSHLGDCLGFCGTLHGFMLQLLQRHGARLGFGQRITVLDQEQAEAMLLRQAQEQQFRGKISDLKEALLVGPGQNRRRPSPAELVVAGFWMQLRSGQMVTFDSILHYGLELLAAGAVPQDRWTHLLVDEFQDSAEIDARIYAALPIRNKFYLGDCDQAVFGFRGGSIEGLNRLWLDPKTEKILLEHNYRSDQEICRAAQRLIEHNPGRPAKKIRPVSSQEGMASCWHHRTPADEISWIADEIRARALTLSRDSVAVLVRTNRLVQEIRQGLEARGIQVARRIQPELPGDWDLTRTLLALLNDPDNDLMAGWYLERVHGLEVARRARLEAAAAGVTLNEASLHIEPVELENVPTMLAKAGISRESIALVAAIRGSLAGNARIGDLLVAVAEWGQPTEELSSGLEVLTMHSAKGREFDTVFLPAFEQYICPGKGDLEEERRLAYVAFTRARHQLLVSYCQLREPPFCRGLVEVRPSQFVQEAGL